MASISWPTVGNFPQVPQKGFTESIGTNIIRSPMDAGPAKLRRRGNRPNTINVSFFLSQSQVDTLENFVLNIIKGTKRFNFLHPRTNISKEMRIVAQQDGQLYTLNYIGPGYYIANLILEVLP